MHRATAAEVFGVPLAEVSSEQRRYAKVINFGLIYGMGAFGLAQSLGIEPNAARRLHRPLLRPLSRREALHGRHARQAAERRLCRDRVRPAHPPASTSSGGNGPRRAAAERPAINAPMQGTASDLIKMAMVAVQDAIDTQGRATRIVMQVHDELVLEVPEAELDWVRAEVPRAWPAWPR